jgi:hypothetical protein
MQERLVALAEAMPVLFHCRGWNRRVAKPRVLFHAGRHIALHVAFCGFISVVKALARSVVEFGRRRGCGINSYRLRVRAPSQRKGQQQGPKCKPSLHWFVLDGRISSSRPGFCARLTG